MSAARTISVLQPGYLPWLGFFEQMALADAFIYLDDVQYTKQDWRSRNRIKLNGKALWLTVPVEKSPTDTPLRNIKISYAQNWPQKHLGLIRQAYGKTPYFSPLFEEMSDILNSQTEYLWVLDVQLTEVFCKHLNLSTPISYSSDVPRQTSDKNLRLIEICQHHNATHFYDGKAAEDFIDTDLFKQNGLDVIFQNYQHPVYSQGKGEFVPYLSIIDLLFHTGPDALDVLMSSPHPKELAA